MNVDDFTLKTSDLIHCKRKNTENEKCAPLFLLPCTCVYYYLTRNRVCRTQPFRQADIRLGVMRVCSRVLGGQKEGSPYSPITMHPTVIFLGYCGYCLAIVKGSCYGRAACGIDKEWDFPATLRLNTFRTSLCGT